MMQKPKPPLRDPSKGGSGATGNQDAVAGPLAEFPSGLPMSNTTL
jgi:hypothetical protein